MKYLDLLATYVSTVTRTVAVVGLAAWLGT